MLWVLIIVNLLSFLLCGIDKYLAIQNKRRIPEQMLFFFSFLGGCFGFLLAMFLFHHNNKRKRCVYVILID